MEDRHGTLSPLDASQILSKIDLEIEDLERSTLPLVYRQRQDELQTRLENLLALTKKINKVARRKIPTVASTEFGKEYLDIQLSIDRLAAASRLIHLFSSHLERAKGEHGAASGEKDDEVTNGEEVIPIEDLQSLVRVTELLNVQRGGGSAAGKNPELERAVRSIAEAYSERLREMFKDFDTANRRMDFDACKAMYDRIVLNTASEGGAQNTLALFKQYLVDSALRPLTYAVDAPRNRKEIELVSEQVSVPIANLAKIAPDLKAEVSGLLDLNSESVFPRFLDLVFENNKNVTEVMSLAQERIEMLVVVKTALVDELFGGGVRANRAFEKYLRSYSLLELNVLEKRFSKEFEEVTRGWKAAGGETDPERYANAVLSSWKRFFYDQLCEELAMGALNRCQVFPSVASEMSLTVMNWTYTKLCRVMIPALVGSHPAVSHEFERECVKACFETSSHLTEMFMVCEVFERAEGARDVADKHLERLEEETLRGGLVKSLLEGEVVSRVRAVRESGEVSGGDWGVGELAEVAAGAIQSLGFIPNSEWLVADAFVEAVVEHFILAAPATPGAGDAVASTTPATLNNKKRKPLTAREKEVALQNLSQIHSNIVRRRPTPSSENGTDTVEAWEELKQIGLLLSLGKSGAVAFDRIAPARMKVLNGLL